ncbi:MAG: dihydropteroate synthase [Alicyclobacillus sp.]|nr:dihydropteroate synthase [Alicyclobacillus sp.]
MAQAGRTLVMGIVNVTPDSFSDGGRYLRPEDAIRHAHSLVQAGADVLDIGAESTRPGAEVVPADEEWARLAPVLRELARDCPVPLSVDTYKAEVAARALDAGASIINDVWGGLRDPDILKVVADAGCPYIWMHNSDTLADEDAFEVLCRDTEAGIERCLAAGIARDKLWLDPGIGFAKTTLGNLLVLRNLGAYCNHGYPVLLGVSRKSVIGRTLDLPVNERLEGSLAIAALGVWAGVAAIRVHDVRETVRVCRMVEAIRHAGQ